MKLSLLLTKEAVEMPKLYFVTDLDRTIIHSKHPDYYCVESIGQKEITYMTSSSYEKLQELLLNQQLIFVPCTMRSLSQTLRIQFLRDYHLPFLICTNGAQIYVNGQLDLEWEKHMRLMINEDMIQREFEVIQQLGIDYERLDLTEGFYLSMKFSDDEAAKNGWLRLKEELQTSNEIMLVGRKVFIMDQRINKERALSYLIERFNWQHIVTSGDSEVDEQFTKIGRTILPGHACFKHDHAKVTTANGILATEEILDYLSSELESLM